MLFSKKQVPDSKVLKDLVEEGAASLELGLMVLGGAASIIKKDGDGDTAMGEAMLPMLPKAWLDLRFSRRRSSGPT